MAYGVKYRLEFSDVLGNGKKVEILQDGYTGEVLPMIGTGNPVEITWDEDDDFYEPIIGSSCKINLMVTDDVSYDNFWEGDEFEYKVIVYYAQKQVDEFVNRVEQFAESGNGRIEVPECIESTFTQEITITSEFRQRVQEDGGVVDTLSCISASITDSKVKNYEVFWQGFLYVDGFQESFGTKPYPIVLKALDGLGTLDAYDPPLEGTLPVSFSLPYSLTLSAEYNKAKQILDNLNLGMDLYWQGETQVDPATPTAYLRMWSIAMHVDPDGEIIDAKTILKYILRQSNSRIFQAFGRWYVVKNSKYLDSVFKDQYYDRSVYKLALGNGQNEIIDFQVFRSEEYEYDLFGTIYTYDAVVYKGKADHNVSRRVKSDLLPLQNDMVVEYLPPLKKVIQRADQTLYNRFFRSFFYYSPLDFLTTPADLVAVYGSVDEHDIVEGGNRSYKLTNYTTSSSTKTLALRTGDSISYDFVWVKYGNIKADFGYYIDSTSTNPNYKILYTIIVRYTPLFGTPTTAYWDVENDTLQTSITYNEVDVTDASELNTWNQNSVTLGGLLYDVSVGINFYFPYITSATGYNALYLDNINIYQDLGNPSNKILEAKRDVNSGIYEVDLLPAESFRRYHPDGELGDLQNNAQEILNDYRNFVPRYEGTFYNNNSKPITPLCKPYIDFGDDFKGYQSEMVDGMKYNMKANEYSLIMHTSNNDPDVTATFQKKT
jgi:hypothetical protein